VPYERRQPVLARFLIGQMFGVALGQVLGGVGADYLGAGPVFVALAVWFTAAAWLMSRFTPSRREAHQRAAGSVAMRFASVFALPWARVVLLTVVVEGVLLVGAIAFVPTHLHRVYGLPLTVAGAIVMLCGVGGLVYAALSPILVHRWGEPDLASGGGILLGLCFTVIARGSMPLMASLACVIAGLDFYMLHNTLQVNATQMAPAQRGSSLALFVCALFLGHATGVTLASMLAERVGTAPVIAGAGVMLLGVGLRFAAAHRRKP
jgi:predicted MFS family arabinose efflux permease